MKFVKFTSLLLALLLCVAPAFAEEDNAEAEDFDFDDLELGDDDLNLDDDF